MSFENLHICGSREFKPGDLPPPNEDYLAWHEWAEVQYRAGIKQVECGRCGRWKTPQELADFEDDFPAWRGGEDITIKRPVCTKCHDG